MDETQRLELVKLYERYLKADAKLASFSRVPAAGSYARSNVADYYKAVEEYEMFEAALYGRFGRPGIDFPVYFHVKHIHNNWACKGIKHNSRNRSREYVTVEATGMTTEQLIDTYRENVCTHCFPDAPVAEWRAEAKAKATAEREAAKAARAADKAAKAITMPDGSPLMDVLDTKIATLVTAQRELVDAIMTVEFVEKRYPMRNREFFAKYEAFIQRAAEAIVVKTNAESKTAVLAEARAKAEKKFKKEYR